MSTIEKLLARMFCNPVPNDITVEELVRVARHLGLEVLTGGNHQIRIRCNHPKRTIPIPCHGKTVKPAYIAEFTELVEDMRKEENL